MVMDMMRLLSRRQAIAGALGLAALLRLRAPALAAAARPVRLSPQDEAELARVQAYLDEIKTLQSRFQQFSGEGGTAAGTIYLQRPGKMRIVYDDPTPILIVADGREVYYWDKKLQELSQINVD